ncbi:HAD hydrolase-like protein [Thermoleptolyngbya sichuanensis A183]|uniref:HAD hydrolase-like protein n=1 Tax=Thermoleptolyngbya sichuanensis A183 TaxID=2737172 RepID=A0A6M8B9N3_9CYAN|nr:MULTISPECIES: HAD hydrolase-like protein [Thermoleptolyngbya]QKD84129.1 HAD hydrolase-like protein [Thermoleptolyngbya sichuanensis A183]
MKTILFDFDGTIADSFDAVLQITNRLAREFGYEPASPSEIKRLQNLSSREIIRQSNIPMFRLPLLLRRLKLEMSQEINHLQPIAGIQAALVLLQQQGHRLGIVTSNTADNVVAFLRNHQMEGLFDYIQPGVALFGKGRSIRRIARQHQIDPASLVYVGDETRDIEAAQAIAIPVIAVGWGFNSTAALAACHPDALVQEPGELVTAIAQLDRQESQTP